MSDTRLLPVGSSPLEVAAARACADIENTPVPLRRLWSPDSCPANLLPWLAWAFSVDRWDENWPEETKRAVIRDAYFIHCHKGTIGAVRRVVEPLGYVINVTEWWETSDPPGTFRLDIGVLESGITEEMYFEMERLIADAKPASRHLIGLNIIQDIKRLAKEQNGRDIPEKDVFVRNIGAARAFSGTVSIGGGGDWTTAEFIAWLEQQGALNHPCWMCKGSWSYGDNRTITDTGCGNIQLAGAVVEVMGVRGAMTIRVTTPTTATAGVVNAQFTYVNHGDDYLPGWRRDFNTANPPPVSYPVGAPIPWPSDTVPPAHALMQGQPFDKSVYPLLAVAYPSGVIPDMRGQTIKGRPDSRAVLSQELDGIKWHDHGATVASTDLGNRDTTGFDYGTKPVSVFDYGTKSTTGAGAHNHPISGRTQFGQAGDVVAMSNTGSDRTNWGAVGGVGDHAHAVGIGAHDHVVGIGAHAHSVYIGAHSHGVTVSPSGQAENTVKNTAFNYLVRLA